MKFIVFLFVFIITNSAQAQDLQKLWNMVAPGNKVKTTDTKTNQYKFVTPPKDKKLGNYRVNCYLDSGLPIPELTNLQVKEIETNFVNYNYITIDNKIIQAPIEKCVNIQN